MKPSPVHPHPDFSVTVPVSQTGVEASVKRICSKSFDKTTEIKALKMALSMVDLTTLEGTDTPGRVRQLCSLAQSIPLSGEGVPSVAAVCVYPNRIRLAREYLGNSPINIASVATFFPSGMGPLPLRLKETRYAVEEGADEIDMVISRWAFLKGDYSGIYDEIAAVKEVCGTVHLKVILETGELETLENVRKASDIAMYAGADFIKTSTGKISSSATLPVTLVMLQAIRDFYIETGKAIGMKPAGGIRDAKSALPYLRMTAETLGKKWLNPALFRFGASALANDLLSRILKTKAG